MFVYLIKRLLSFLPAFFIVTLLTFLLSERSPTDPIANRAQDHGASSRNMSATQSGRIINELYERHQLNTPLFYLSIQTQAHPDTLYKITNKGDRELLSGLIYTYGNWEEIAAYYEAVESLPELQSKGDLKSALLDNDETIRSNALKSLNGESSVKIRALNQQLTESSTRYKVFIPKITWNGVQNRYNTWLFGNEEHDGFLAGEFGFSLIDGSSVTVDIWRKFWNSLELILISIILAYLFSIPTGLYSAYYHNSPAEKTLSSFLFLLYAVPSFFAGLLLITFFASSEYLDWFNAVGYKAPDISANTYFKEWNYWQRFSHSWPFMILPIATYTYGQITYISKLMKASALDVLSENYILAAKAKGISRNTLIWKHLFRNALSPIITLFGNILPAAVGGSVIVEILFDYEGMGKFLIQAIRLNDTPALVSLVGIAVILTMLGYLVSDVLLALNDKRIRFSR